MKRIKSYKVLIICTGCNEYIQLDIPEDEQVAKYIERRGVKCVNCNSSLNDAIIHE